MNSITTIIYIEHNISSRAWKFLSKMILIWSQYTIVYYFFSAGDKNHYIVIILLSQKLN